CHWSSSSGLLLIDSRLVLICTARCRRFRAFFRAWPLPSSWRFLTRRVHLGIGQAGGHQGGQLPRRRDAQAGPEDLPVGVELTDRLGPVAFGQVHPNEEAVGALA